MATATSARAAGDAATPGRRPRRGLPLVRQLRQSVGLQRGMLVTGLVLTGVFLLTAALAPLLAQGRDLQLGVNVSVRHLQAGCLAADVARALAASGVPASRLMLEITESVLVDAEDRVERELAALREAGCVISIDDFGKGHSTLARLSRLPVDVLKMDRDFVAHIEDDPRTAAVVASVVELGRTLGMDVVAEGVETPGQLAALRRLGCRFLQGYLLGRPVPATDLPAVLAAPVAGLLDGDRLASHV